AGVGLAMLWRNRSQQTNGDRLHPSSYPGMPSTSYFSDQRQDLGSKVSGAASKVGDAASTGGGAGAGGGGGGGGAVGPTAEGAERARGEVVDRAGATAQQVGWKLDSF